MPPKRKTVRQAVEEAALAKIAKKAKKAREPKLFDGERHGAVWIPGEGFERTNYMGPGTRLVDRIKRGDQGKTAIDIISNLHDIDYTLLSGTAASQEEQVKLAREADDRMIRNGWRAYKQGKEGLFNTVQGAGLIKAKTLLEDWGLLDPTKFLSTRSLKYATGAENRDATEYELLLRSRTRLLETGVTADTAEHARNQYALNEFQ